MLALRFRGAAPRAVTGALVRRACLSTDALVPANPGSGKQVSTEQAKPQLDTRAVSAFTGTPKEMLESRVVKIYKPAPTVQNATQPTLVWKMQWEDDLTQRWTNPLMGWTSTRDPLSNTHMTLEFSSSEDAVRFARNNGWKYEVQETLSQNLAIVSKGPKKYSDNFQWKGPKGRPFPELYEPPPPPPKK